MYVCFISVMVFCFGRLYLLCFQHPVITFCCYPRPHRPLLFPTYCGSLFGQQEKCIQQLVSVVRSCVETADPEAARYVAGLLDDRAEPVGFLINERFINIPATVSLPHFKSLRCVDCSIASITCMCVRERQCG